MPVIDLALMLDLTVTAPPRQLLLAEADGVKAGFMIDEVSGVGDLDGPVEGAESDLLLGMVYCDGELLGIIDVPRVLGSLRRASR